MFSTASYSTYLMMIHFFFYGKLNGTIFATGSVLRPDFQNSLISFLNSSAWRKNKKSDIKKFENTYVSVTV